MNTSPASAPSAAREHIYRIAGLDGLRAVAVGLVLVDHLLPAGANGGFVGVDVFFVISGFLITGLLIRETETRGRIRFAGFWRRRARRLLPALGLLLTVCTAAAALEGGDVLLRIGSQLLGALTFSSNWVFIAQGSSYFDLTAPELFRNLWSLAVEEQFYLVWPFVVLVLAALPTRARRAPVLLIAAGSMALMAVMVGSSSITRVYFGTDTHAFGLAIGAALALGGAARPAFTGAASSPALATSRIRAAWTFAAAAGIATLLGLAWSLDESSPWTFPWGLAAASAATALVIAALVAPGAERGPLTRMLEARPMRWIGRRSYGLYLWHWPLLILLQDALPQLPRTGAGGWTLGLLALAISLAAAALSYRFVEAPIRRDGLRVTVRGWFGAWRASAPSRAALAAGCGAAAVVVATAGVGVASAPARSQTEQELRAATTHPTLPPPPPTPLLPQMLNSGPMPVVPGGIGGAQLTVIGDSVTLAAQPTLEARWPGIDVEAAVSRQASAGVEQLRSIAVAGQLRPVLVWALGTNGPFPVSLLGEVRGILGPERGLVLVTTQSPRPWVGQVNQTITDFCQSDPRCAIAPWFDDVQPQLDILNRDQTHFGGAGARLWTDSVAEGIGDLASGLPAKPLLPQQPTLLPR